MSNDKVSKYFEVRFFSLAPVAISILVVFVFLFIFLALREQYIYAVVFAALAVVLFFGAMELCRYAKKLRREEGGNQKLNA